MTALESNSVVADAKAPSQTASISHSSRWVLAGTVLSKPIQLFTAVLIARFLGPAGFGLFGLATSMAVTLAMIAALGLGDASYKYVAEYHRTEPKKALEFAAVITWSATIVGMAMFVTLWVGQGAWRSWVFPAGTSRTIVGLCLCLALTNLVFSLLSGVLAGLQHFREFAILNVLQAAASGGFALVLSFYGSEGALLAYVLGSTVCLVWGTIKLWHITNGAIFLWPGLKAFSRLKSILTFSAPIWIGAFALTPVVTFTLAFLARQPNGQYQLGLFNTANGLRMFVAILPGIISLVITPAMIQTGGVHGDRGAYHALLRKSFSALIFLTLPLFILVLFLSDLIFVVYGKAYQDSFRLFMPLTASAAIAAIGTPLIAVMMTKDKTWWSLAFVVAKSLLLVALTLWLVPKRLAMGLAWAFFFSEISFYFVAMEFCIRVNVVPGFIRSSFYSACAVIGTLLLTGLWLPNSARWALAVPLSGFALIYLLRSHSEMANWLASLAPVSLRPRTQKLLALIATS